VGAVDVGPDGRYAGVAGGAGGGVRGAVGVAGGVSVTRRQQRRLRVKIRKIRRNRRLWHVMLTFRATNEALLEHSALVCTPPVFVPYP
jgi:hypothetical protein